MTSYETQAGPSRPSYTPQAPAPSRKRTDSTLRHLQIPNSPYSYTQHQTPSPLSSARTPYTRTSTDSWTSANTTTPTTPPFNRLLGSVLGSPYLTTRDPADNISEFDLVDGASLAVPHAETVTRPASPTPTADYSILDAPSSPTGPPWPDAFDVVADGVYALYASPLAGVHRRLDFPTSSARLGLGLGGHRRSPVRGRGILPRLIDAIATPGRKGKARQSAYYPEGYGPVYSELEPLDGEEGELIDEACFVPDFAAHPRSVTGTDVLALLPIEIALYALSFLDHKALVACSAVSTTWRALALDPLLWADLFAGMESHGWRLDLGRLPSSASGGRRRASKLERRASERSVLAAMARERRNSERSVRSQMRAAKRPGLDGLEEEAPVPSTGTVKRLRAGLHGLDWRMLYKARAELDRRWMESEPTVAKISGHADSVYCLEFDSSRILTGSRDRTIKAWDLKTGKLLGTFWGHAGSVLCLKFDADWERTGNGSSGTMVSGSSDCSVLVWTLSLGGAKGDELKAEVNGILQGHGGGVLDLRMDSEVIVSCSKDAAIRIWSRRTLALLHTLRGHEGPVNAVGLQGSRIVSASGDGRMIIWDVRTGARLRTLEGHERGLACIEFRGDLIVSGSNDCKIKVWDARTGECARTLSGHGALVRALACDPASGRLVSASYDRTIKVWDVHTGRLLRDFKGEHASHIFDVRFDAQRIVSTSHDQKIAILDFGEGLDTTLFA